jgi:hypothetical protein
MDAVTTSLSAQSPSASLAYVRLLILNVERNDPRKASRLLLDFLDVRTEHQAMRLSDDELRIELERIAAEIEL